MKHIKPYAFLGMKLLLIVLCGWGILENVFDGGRFQTMALSYYTIESNLLCFAYFSASFLWNLKNWGAKREIRTLAPRLEGAVVFFIAVTMLIFNFILVPIAVATLGEVHFEEIKGFLMPINLLPHEIVPILVLADWCLFVPKGRLKRKDPLLWLTVPYAYLVFALVRAQVGAPFSDGSRYPYPFLDVDTLGWPMVLLAVGVITLVFFGIAHLFVALDKKRSPGKAEQGK